MTQALLGFDVGGTKVEASILVPTKSSSQLSILTNSGERYFEIRFRERIPTERHKGYQSIVERVSVLARRAIEECGLRESDLCGVGFGLPGTISPTGVMLNGNTQALVGKDLSKDLKNVLGWSCEFYSENDANCFALAESLLGAGKKFIEVQEKSSSRTFSDLLGIGIILGTGCGGGIVTGGKILRGRHGGAAEFGHTVLVSDGLSCYCGQKGCAEQYLSGPAFEASFSGRKYPQVQEISQAKDIFTAAENNEPIALAVVNEYRNHLAQFLSGLTSVFDPDFFVLGGGVSSQKLIYHGLEEGILRRTFLPLKEIAVFSSELGDSSGVIGAALLPFSSSGEL